MIKGIDHMGLAVRDTNAALDFYEGILGLKANPPQIMAGGEMKLTFIPVGENYIELVEPTTETSPIAQFIRRKGEGINHVCLEVDDIEAEVRRLKARGISFLQEPTQALPDRIIAFIHPKWANGTLVELYQKGRMSNSLE
jgi:methylmalonyl-CoA/ethylmalonyl-CoA epimerase